MKKYKYDLSERLLDFAVEIIKFVLHLPKNSIGQHIKNQLARSGTSPGANYEEACGAQSRADFIHKMQIVLKELKESRYWLRLISRTDLIDSSDIQLNKLISESEELANIIAKSLITAREKK